MAVGNVFHHKGHEGLKGILSICGFTPVRGEFSALYTRELTAKDAKDAKEKTGFLIRKIMLPDRLFREKNLNSPVIVSFASFAVRPQKIHMTHSTSGRIARFNSFYLSDLCVLCG